MEAEVTVQYDYESLGPERFQQLCQAVLVSQYPDVQCFPVGMPDGGRDASIPHATIADAVVYQVKYRKPTPNKLATADEIVKWATEALEGELTKVEALATRGAERYILMTNAQCSSHPDSGTRDRLQGWLDENMPLPAQVWWRDDIDRRLDGEREIKRTYGLLRDVVGLAELLELGQRSEANDREFIRIARSDRRVSALTKYLAHQYRRDRVVKFKQAELEPQLLDVFIDVPLTFSPEMGNTNLFHRLAPTLDVESIQSDSRATMDKWQGLLSVSVHRAFTTSNRAEGLPAASVLLSENLSTNDNSTLQRFVLEGAPGQGKSTVGQYICQVHRARLLNNAEVPQFPASHRSSPIRLPLHVDFRDLAAWLRKQDPFDVKNQGTPEGWAETLESFLAAQIRRASGGMDFSVVDLDSVLRATPALLVLDGLDEVPDLTDRRAVVSCVNEALARIEPFSPSFRTIATSRPSSFAKTPGFSRKEYTYLTLGDLPLASVLEYTDGWLKSRNVTYQAAHEIRQVLGQRLGQPHIVDLARNPMQLAILLWLVRKKGLSLPDKRTALYREYMETFLDREAEKSPIVRDERELILDLHGYVAWELHCLAETGQSNGSVSEPKLKSMLKGYLQGSGYKKRKIDLVDQLFTGMTDRVMVLTSRVEGSFEFEVQPLREYFAAKYLYSTARSSSPGAERSGNRSDRFEALLRNPYWWNVTRFYAGFSDVGELANIAELLEELAGSNDDFSLISYSREAALSLLRDQVFSQKPRSLTRVIDLVCSDESVALLNVAKMSLSLPADSGGEEVADKMMKRIEKLVSAGAPIYEAQFLSANTPSAELATWWFTKFSSARHSRTRFNWLIVGSAMRLLQLLPPPQLSDLIRGMRNDLNFWHVLLSVNPGATPNVDLEFDAFLNAYRFGVGLDTPYYRQGSSSVAGCLGLLSLGHVYFMVENGATWPGFTTERFISRADEQYSHALLQQIVAAFSSTVLVKNARSSIDSWVDLNAALEAILGGQCRRTLAIAVAAGEVRSGRLNRRDVYGLLDKSVSPVLRARYARQRRNDTAWWNEQLQCIESVEDAFFALCCMMHWAPASTFFDNRIQLSAWVSDLDPYELRIIRSMAPPAPTNATPGEENRSGPPPRTNPGLLYLASARMSLEESIFVLSTAARAHSSRSSPRDRYMAGMASAAWLQNLIRSSRAHWPEGLLEELIEAYSIVRQSTVAYSVYAHNRQLSPSVARHILRHAAELPEMIVGDANRALTADVGRRATPLATVAAKGDWFDMEVVD